MQKSQHGQRHPSPVAAYLPEISVMLAGRWKDRDLISTLEEDEKNKLVFTLITPEKYASISSQYESDKHSEAMRVGDAAVDHPQKKTLDHLVKRFNFSRIVLPLSNLALQFENKISASQQKEIDNMIVALDDLKQLVDARNYCIYDNELDVIFSKSMAFSIFTAICKRGMKLEGTEYADLKKADPPVKICVCSAGKAELGIVTLGYIYLIVAGYSVEPRVDLGVDNIKKTKSIIGRINEPDVFIVTAGMEAILPTVLASISFRPIVAVPSNVSYGFGADGYV
jgi:hypothetical protein